MTELFLEIRHVVRVRIRVRVMAIALFLERGPVVG